MKFTIVILYRCTGVLKEILCVFCEKVKNIKFQQFFESLEHLDAIKIQRKNLSHYCFDIFFCYMRANQHNF